MLSEKVHKDRDNELTQETRQIPLTQLKLAEEEADVEEVTAAAAEDVNQAVQVVIQDTAVAQDKTIQVTIHSQTT
jgi:hypothetical protein